MSMPNTTKLAATRGVGAIIVELILESDGQHASQRSRDFEPSRND